MKQLIVTVIISSAIIFGCSSAKQAQAQQVLDTYGQQEQLADTFLHSLQQENDIVLAAYTESLAWGMHYNYTIAARKNGNWKGYSYTISGTRANSKSNMSEVPVNKQAADAALQYINNTALWGGKDNHETCNMQVSDGSSSYLLMVAGSRVLRVSYYMPEAYQTNCPDSSRGLFIEAFGKVRVLFAKNENQ